MLKKKCLDKSFRAQLKLLFLGFPWGQSREGFIKPADLLKSLSWNTNYIYIFINYIYF